MAYRVVADYTAGASENTNVKVFVRARPPAYGGEDVEKYMQEQFEVPADNPKRITLKDVRKKDEHGGGGEHAFSFDRCFWTEASQAEIFSAVCQPQVDHCLRGYNSCCFAYGQTGSGKTHSMFGPDEDASPTSRGLIPRAVEYLFNQLNARAGSKEVGVLVSFLEIYCDKIRDLGRAYQDTAETGEKTSTMYLSQQMRRSQSFSRGLGREGTSAAAAGHAARPTEDVSLGAMDLEIHEDQSGNVFVKDLSMVPVSSAAEVMHMIESGLRLRATHETKMNAVSSRSHTVFTITVLQRERSTGNGISGKLNLVDLAGSERLKKSESEGMRLKEALHINSSLTALGKVVMALDPNAESNHVPYRDSKLTRLLQNSLGGNSYTTVLATIHPAPTYSEECLSTLQFANRCRVVQNQPRVTYLGGSEDDKDRKIKSLTNQVTALKKKLARGGIGGDGSLDLDLLLLGGGEGMGADMFPLGEEEADGGRGSGFLAKQRAQAAAIARATNQLIIEILNDLNIEASLAPDGRVQLPDGRLVGHRPPSPVAAAGESVDSRTETDASELIGSKAGGGGGEGGGESKTASRDMRRKLRAAEKERNALQRKLNEMHDNLEREIRERHREVTRMKKEHKQDMDRARETEASLRGTIAHLQEVMEMTRAKLSTTHDDQIRNLVTRTDELLRKQADQLHLQWQAQTQTRLIDTGGTVGGGAGLMLGVGGDEMEGGAVGFTVGYESSATGTKRTFPMTDRQLQATFKAQESTKLADLENLKEQYEYWLRCKTEEAQKFVVDFNKYRTKSKKTLQSTQQELLRLYEYACAVTDILNNIEKGRYSLRQTGRTTVPCIPPPHRPLEPALLARSEHYPTYSSSQPHQQQSQQQASLSTHGAEPQGDAEPMFLPDQLPVTRSLLQRLTKEASKAQALETRARETGVKVNATRHPKGKFISSGTGGKGPGLGLDLGRITSRPLQGNASSALRGATQAMQRPASAPRHRSGGHQPPTHSVGDGNGMETARGRLQTRSKLPSAPEDSSDDESQGAPIGTPAEHAEAMAAVAGGIALGQGAHSLEGGPGWEKNRLTHLQLDPEQFTRLMEEQEWGDRPRKELTDALMTVQLYLTQSLPSKIQELVVSELKSADTVHYMTELEERLASKEGALQDQARRFNDLKIAHEALTRRVSGMTWKNTKTEYGSSRARIREDGAVVGRGNEALSRPSPRGFRHTPGRRHKPEQAFTRAVPPPEPRF